MSFSFQIDGPLPIWRTTASHAFLWGMIALAFLFFFHPDCLAAASPSKRVSLAAQIGNWQPHSLNDAPSFETFGKAGATPFWGLAFCVPIRGHYALQASFGYWSLRDLQEVEPVHSLTLHPLCLDFKYWLIPDYRLSAFVMYGGGAYWGLENETTPLGSKLRKARAGWGVNLGAGFDLALPGRIGIGALFQYHFVRFQQSLGGIDDFSGPKVSAAFYFFL
ncbi:hypothetical protein JW906_06695 [bacterium]|nr:hypothetical protein [bacterium]